MHLDPDGPNLARTPSEARLIRAALFLTKHRYPLGSQDFRFETGEDFDAVIDLLAEVDRHKQFWRVER